MMHMKCIFVDDRIALSGNANATEAVYFWNLLEYMMIETNPAKVDASKVAVLTCAQAYFALKPDDVSMSIVYIQWPH
jgi:phosphatidylserine/phosphatidylglycerophosphate/cardiolipin synthase-like enzyme